MSLDRSNSSVRKGFLKDKKTSVKSDFNYSSYRYKNSLDSKAARACYKCKKSSVKSNFLEVYTGFGLETSAKQLCANCFERGYSRIPGKAELFSMDFRKGTMYCIDDDNQPSTFPEAAAREASLFLHHSFSVRLTGQSVTQFVQLVLKKRLQLSWGVWAHASGQAVSGVSPRLPATNPRL